MTEAVPWRSEERDCAPREPWDEGQPQLEQRTAPRFTLLIRTAKLVAPSGEYLCVVRDVSSDGIKVRTFHPLPAGEDFAIELASGERHPVERVWDDGEIAGFRFAVPAALDRLLAEAPEGLRRRPVRLRLAVPLAIHSPGRRPLEATFVDISQYGGCIECADHLAMDERIRLEAPGLPEVVARVRWRRRPLYGLIFEQTFRFDELARLTAPHQGATPPAFPTRSRAAG